MASYQEGGLAAATGDDPDEQEDPSMVSRYGEQAREISKMSREKALGRLQQGYDKLSQQKYDRSQKWLALAQGMLAPTKTGGFGESLGASAGLLREEGKEQRAFEQNRAERLARMEAEMSDAEQAYADREIDILGEEAGLEVQQGIKLRGQPFDTYIEDPEDPNKKLRVKGMMRNDGSWYVPRDKHGNVAILPDTLDPLTNYLREQAKEQGKLDPKLLDGRVKTVTAEKDRLAKSYYGLTILDALDAEGNQSGGAQAYLQRFREFWGSTAQDVTDRGMMMNIMAQQLFESLAAFGTQINAKELAVAESISGGIHRPSGINRQMLRDLVRKLETTIGETNRLVGKFGTPMQKEMLETPMTDYGIGENLQKRAQRIGLTLGEHIPFSEAPTGPAEVIPREEGALGTLKKPHVPSTIEEAAAWKADGTVQKGDYMVDPRDGKLRKM